MHRVFTGSDFMDMLEHALALLPAELRIACGQLRSRGIEEIRLRRNRIPAVLTRQGELSFSDKPLSGEELELVLERASGASLHAHMDEIAMGYINHNGLRIGFGATAVIKDGRLISFKDFSSLNIRIPSRFYGEIDEIYNLLRSGCSENILIVSPPGAGKTTLLREFIRRFSNDGTRISVADERNEIAAASQGSFYFDLGRHTDVLVGAGKKTAAMLLLRGMNPQMIALDEISRHEDMEAIYDIAGCGVGILATAHGKSVMELKKRELYRKLLNEHIFTDAVVIENSVLGRKFIHKRLT